MLTELLTPDRIGLLDRVEGWEQSIRIASSPLLEQGAITEEYVDAMIDNVRKLGPYIIITPKVAIPHARPENGVLNMSISLLRVQEGISFSEREGHTVHLLFVLAAPDKSSHITLLTELAVLLENTNHIETLLHAESVHEILACLGSSIKENIS
ncbi:PTS sugar transporter subunit IIA [Paenibacillus kribbensis]|uniref:PTS sugar transporter subunit IIA n=1 Tax=Paenibacillus kribbensis TaxID=172713 RepID=UPI000838A804|nr:PTS sugar transporter subunit IIA [Paenibacillus kribbensis]